MEQQMENIPINNTAVITDDVNSDNNDESFQWTVGTVFQALTLFVLAGCAEIGGGYLVWKAIRGNLSSVSKQYLYAIIGSFILVLYGFIPTLQPTDTFGRIYAVYGGFFIVLSYVAGYVFDHDIPDIGDYIGSAIALFGVCLILFWPR